MWALGYELKYLGVVGGIKFAKSGAHHPYFYGLYRAIAEVYNLTTLPPKSMPTPDGRFRAQQNYGLWAELLLLSSPLEMQLTWSPCGASIVVPCQPSSVAGVRAVRWILLRLGLCLARGSCLRSAPM